MTKLPTLPELDAADLGPAMQALTALRRNFVIAKVFYGLNDSNAARAAGFAESVAGHMAHQIAHREDVQRAVEEECRKLMKSEGPKSILTLVSIRDDKTAKAADRIKASTELLNRAGLHAITEHHEHQHAHVSEAEMDRRILALAAELGMSPDQAKLMLIAPSDFTKNADGVFEITPAEPPQLSTDPRQVAKREARRRRAGMTPEEIEADKRRIQADRAEQLRRERAEHDGRRAGITIDVEEIDAARADAVAEPEVW